MYPLIRGRDIDRWSASPSVHILLTQDPDKRTGVDESWLKINLPLSYAYLRQFHDELVDRSGYKKFFQDAGAPFYTIYNVGPYTMVKYKVGWPREASSLRCAVFGAGEFRGNSKMIVPDQTVQFIDFENELEAHYVCAALNSAPAVAVPLCYATDITTHILEVIGVPRFQSSNPSHRRLAELSKQIHQLSEMPDRTIRTDIELEVDARAAEIWGVSDQELTDIRQTLAELG